MEFKGEGIDDILINLYRYLIKNGKPNNEATRGCNIELLGVVVRIANPRARLSRSENRGKPFSALGELLWYLSKSDRLEFIKPYVEKYEDEATEGILHGAYGPRLFAMRDSCDQIDNVIRLLREKPSTRRAVVQIFNAEDISQSYREIPCTTTLQFFVRSGLLHMFVTMRSNDAYFGLPHDVFCFTMLQEMIACKLGVELGEYCHFANSMHIYNKYITGAKDYIEEGFQQTIKMPVMPKGDAFKLIPKLLEAENKIRRGEAISPSQLFRCNYWADIVRLLKAFWASGQPSKLNKLKPQFADPMYKIYLEERKNMRNKILDIKKCKG